MLEWKLYPDGSFDVTGAAVRLRGCYPSVDGHPLRPLQVEVQTNAQGGRICYYLEDGRLEIVLTSDGEALILSPVFRGTGATPCRVAPLAGAKIEGADRFFRQGLGLGGQSGFCALPPEKFTDSFTLTAVLAGDDTTLVVSARDVRRFQQESALYPPMAAVEPLRFEAAFKSEGIPFDDGVLRLPSLYVTVGATPWAALRAEAICIAAEMKARAHQPQSYHWCSWYYQYYYLTQQTLSAYVQGFKAITPPLPLQSVQIDAGYFPHIGDWLQTNERWPAGMAAAFHDINQAGYRPGIWIGPFMVGSRSRLYTEHPDWVLHDLDGNPVVRWRWYGETRVWGLQDEEVYVLDTSHPEAMAYLRTVFRTFRQWGVTFFKTDFLLWGLCDSSTVRRHTLGKTSVEYLRDVLHMIRQEIGPESFWLGCIAPFAPLIGYVDAVRTAGDVSSVWKACQNMLQESVGCQHFNNVWYQNDPDAIILRRTHNHMSDVDVRSLALWMGMLGGVVNTSDPLHELPADRLALWRFLEPGPQKWTAQYPFWGHKRPLEVMLRAFADRHAWAVLLLNAQDRTITQRFCVADLVGEDQAACFDWRPDGYETLGTRSELTVELEPHHSKLYYLSRDGTPPVGLTLGGASRADM